MTFFGKQTTYRKLGEQVAAVAEGLRKLGVKPGEVRICPLCCPTARNTSWLFMPAMRIGANVVEHNPLYTSPWTTSQFPGPPSKGGDRLG